MARILLGLGSNQDAQSRLTNALQRLEQELEQLQTSDWFESHALRGGANYLNLVASAHTDLSIAQLRELLHLIEDEQGRTRGDEDSGCALDIDLICYNRQQLTTEEYRLPREDITEHAHVLWPLALLCPDETHPELGIGYADLWETRKDKLLENQTLWPLERHRH